MEQEMGFRVEQLIFCGFLAGEAVDRMLNEDGDQGSVGRRETAAGGGNCFLARGFTRTLRMLQGKFAQQKKRE